jgi:ubiquinone/menaquinone biosynthesis C-methylase UbiE
MKNKRSCNLVIKSFNNLYKKERSLPVEMHYSEYVKEMSKGKRVLDVGCGTGALVKFLRKKGIKAYGIDISREAVKKANYKFVILSPITGIPFPNDFFDVVGCHWVLEHVGEYEKAIKEMVRVGKRQIIYTINNATIRRPIKLIKYLILKKRFTHCKPKLTRHGTYNYSRPVFFDIKNELKKNGSKIIKFATYYDYEPKTPMNFLRWMVISKILKKLPLINTLGSMIFIVSEKD